MDSNAFAQKVNCVFYFYNIYKLFIIKFEGWKGKNCSERNCLLNPCLNDGVCKADFDETKKHIDYFCSCPKGYYGEECEHLGN